MKMIAVSVAALLTVILLSPWYLFTMTEKTPHFCIDVYFSQNISDATGAKLLRIPVCDSGLVSTFRSTISCFFYSKGVMHLEARQIKLNYYDPLTSSVLDEVSDVVYTSTPSCDYQPVDYVWVRLNGIMMGKCLGYPRPAVMDDLVSLNLYLDIVDNCQY